MRRAPWPVALLFAASLALLIALAGPVLLFNPWFVGLEQARHGVPAALDASPSAVSMVTEEILADLFLGGDFEVSLDGTEPMLDARERSHMADVGRLVRLLAAIAMIAATGVVLTVVALRREPRRIGRTMVVVSAGIGAVAILLAAIFAVAFEPAFVAFHAVFFPPGTYLFEAGSKLTALFPEGLWFDASLAAGASILLAAAIAGAGGWRLWRASRRSAPQEGA
jgi:uncharacterized membrane protein